MWIRRDRRVSGLLLWLIWGVSSSSLASASEDSTLERRLDQLRLRATSAFAQLASDRRSLKKAPLPDEQKEAEIWDRRSYWTHYLDLVLELRKAASTIDLTPLLPARLSAAQRKFRKERVSVEISELGRVRLDREPSSYSDRQAVLKDAAAVAVYAGLQQNP